MTAFTITSLETKEYNCIAWAAGESDRWWWPDDKQIHYWPDTVPREETMDAFVAAYRTLGYIECLDGVLEPDFEKVVLYEDRSGSPKHAARQLETGVWTSKLGNNVDIEHATPEAVNRFPRTRYGSPTRFMKRRRSTQ